MSETTAQIAHTPGPWSWFVPVHGKLSGMKFLFSGTNKQGFAHTVGLDEPEDTANANLIAAAPDLLAAAKAVEQTCPCDCDINPQWYAAWQALLASIRKAETGQ